MSALRKPAADLLYTIDDLARRPEDGKLHELIEGEIYVSHQPSRHHLHVDWQAEQIEVYRRRRTRLVQAATLPRDDELTSPLLPGFSCEVAKLFHHIPKPQA